MTRDELSLILIKLLKVPGCINPIDRESCLSCIETKRAIEIVQRELKLKDIAEEIPFGNKGNNK